MPDAPTASPASPSPRAVVTDVQRFSVHDGPGIRTLVFFKGCPLRCRWCHNPECISARPQLLFHDNLCVGCGKCAEACPEGCHKFGRDEARPSHLDLNRH